MTTDTQSDRPLSEGAPAEAPHGAAPGLGGEEFAGRDNAPVVAADDADLDRTLRVTAKAVRMIKLTRDEEGLDPSYGLRVAVRGGGCSGFEYALDFDNEERSGDEVIELDGLRIFVDPISSRYLAGTTIDYTLGMQGTGFKFENPRAVGTCGCGTSFAV
ncbi:MAG: iron-sulfur cluster assembly accessory protein [Acidobacteria bacterium]|nr:MAG: iron-sulfur cluster assembly accessory protein [Acidobacteriota bacterium]REK05599.1 MAG: iron-sulfur cluster assembly accessory protein [Acidobacteriota bacterium]